MFQFFSSNQGLILFLLEISWYNIDYLVKCFFELLETRWPENSPYLLPFKFLVIGSAEAVVEKNTLVFSEKSRW